MLKELSYKLHTEQGVQTNMADNRKNQGQGWHGDPKGHAKAGAQSSGNKNAAQNLSQEDRSKGGSMSGGNFKNDPERASEVASNRNRKQS